MARALVLVVAAGIAAAVLVGWSGGVPGGPRCAVTVAGGAELLAGPPEEVTSAVSRALDGPRRSALRSALGSGPALSCQIRAIPVSDTPKEPPLGLTPRAQELRAQVRAAHGRIPDGGFGPEQTLPGRRASGEHSRGRAIDFFFRPHADPGQARAGWELANWAVAHAQRLGIRTVIYRDRIWTARRSAQGWRDYRFAGPDADNPVNRHLDHVHIEVG